ncbi:hypothetical protein BOTNAR_0044g00320 [Botryotinia narcissicola]|uniref:Uncharacterized protein n=1 Tax=Botryotinia narcissicola TaxID=278944 RepID=A0A4Z1J6Z2_9HELO|nr:hypothetical protein BOTNAR_0044g00320 [Botryotinia narcissicola]
MANSVTLNSSFSSESEYISFLLSCEEHSERKSFEGPIAAKLQAKRYGKRGYIVINPANDLEILGQLAILELRNKISLNNEITPVCRNSDSNDYRLNSLSLDRKHAMMAHEVNGTPTAHKISNNNLPHLNRDRQVIEFFDQQLYQGVETSDKSGGKMRNDMQLDVYWLAHT